MAGWEVAEGLEGGVLCMGTMIFECEMAKKPARMPAGVLASILKGPSSVAAPQWHGPIIRRMNAHANVDPAELEKFASLAHRWWDTQGEFRPLHLMNPLRLQWIESIAALSGCQVLDVGCGGGILSESMARQAGAVVTGIDLATQSLRVAQLHALETGTANVQYREIAAEALAAERPASFDMVTCMEMLEHVPDPASIVRACAQLVRPGGWVFFSTIARNAKAWALAVIAAEYLLKMVPKGTHEYQKFIRPSELAAFCRQAGLNVSHTTGVQFNPLTSTFWLSTDCSVNYMMAAQRPLP